MCREQAVTRTGRVRGARLFVQPLVITAFIAVICLFCRLHRRRSRRFHRHRLDSFSSFLGGCRWLDGVVCMALAASKLARSCHHLCCDDLTAIAPLLQIVGRVRPGSGMQHQQGSQSRNGNTACISMHIYMYEPTCAWRQRPPAHRGRRCRCSAHSRTQSPTARSSPCDPPQRNARSSR